MAAPVNWLARLKSYLSTRPNTKINIEKLLSHMINSVGDRDKNVAYQLIYSHLKNDEDNIKYIHDVDNINYLNAGPSRGALEKQRLKVLRNTIAYEVYIKAKQIAKTLAPRVPSPSPPSSSSPPVGHPVRVAHALPRIVPSSPPSVGSIPFFMEPPPPPHPAPLHLPAAVGRVVVMPSPFGIPKPLFFGGCR